MRLKELRVSHKLTQGEVATAVDLPLTTYRNYEHESRQIPMDALFKLADLYDVSLDYLMGRDVNGEDADKAQLDMLYELLNDEGKQLLLTIVRAFVKSGDYILI